MQKRIVRILILVCFLSGSNNFRDWFHFDASRPSKKKAIVLETDFQIYKRLWITPEKHDKAFSILKKLI